MRTAKFNANKDSYENDDLKYALEYNCLLEKLGLVDVIVAEVCGENDGAHWYWILQMRDGTFAWAEGSCDYTGWDCQSNAIFVDGFKTPEEAIDNLKVSEYEDRKNIKKCLLAQIKEELPFAIYKD